MAQTGRSRARSQAKGKGKEPSKRGGRPARASGSGRATPKASSRYTPPVPREEKVSPRWVPVLMFTLLIAGMAVIICNYLELLPGGAKNWYLIGGLGLITGGFVTSTQYK